jgi:hypothetical protein
MVFPHSDQLAYGRAGFYSPSVVTGETGEVVLDNRLALTYVSKDPQYAQVYSCFIEGWCR